MFQTLTDATWIEAVQGWLPDPCGFLPCSLCCPEGDAQQWVLPCTSTPLGDPRTLHQELCL
jgi:hypothetical protein